MYKTIEDIPPHLFKDRMLRTPASKEFHEYLKYMVENHPDDLDYIYQESQKYIDHGGGFKETFKAWLTKLSNKLNELEGAYE